MPNVLYSNEKTLTIEIPPLTNENGPVSWIRVVVIFVDSELSQKFDESLLKGYAEALEDGTSYYITAQLPNEVSNINKKLPELLQNAFFEGVRHFLCPPPPNTFSVQ